MDISMPYANEEHLKSGKRSSVLWLSPCTLFRQSSWLQPFADIKTTKIRVSAPGTNYDATSPQGRTGCNLWPHVLYHSRRQAWDVHPKLRLPGWMGRQFPWHVQGKPNFHHPLLPSSFLKPIQCLYHKNKQSMLPWTADLMFSKLNASVSCSMNWPSCCTQSSSTAAWNWSGLKPL